MDTESSYLENVVKQSLNLAKNTLDILEEVGVTEVDSKDIISTIGDITISDELIKFLKEQKVPAILFTEESGKVALSKNPKYLITLDDLDGTNNYHRGRGLLPYCTIFSIFDSLEPNFEDVLVAGIIEHNSGKLWHAIRDEGCFLNNEKISTSGKKDLNENAFIMIDHGYCATIEDIQRFSRIYSDSLVRNLGVAGIHLAAVSDGTIDGFTCLTQKTHELGAGYLLIKEAGGFLSDFDGNSFDKQKHDFDATYPIVAAATEELGRTILSELD